MYHLLRSNLLGILTKPRLAFKQTVTFFSILESVQHISGQSASSTMVSGQIHHAASSTSFAAGLQHGAQQVTLQLPSGDFGDDLRRMNAERVKLDEELRDTENKEIKIFVDQFVSGVFFIILS